MKRNPSDQDAPSILTPLKSKVQASENPDSATSSSVGDNADFAIDEATGLDGFLLAALNNPKDRFFLFKLDKELESFIADDT
jgi:hypothetical protein